MTKQHTILVIVLAVIVGAMGGAIAAPLTYTIFPQSRAIIRDIIHEEVPDDRRNGTLRQTIFLDEESATIDVVEQVNNAVVSIQILKDVSQFRRSQFEQFPLDDFFGFPFNIRIPESNTPSQTERRLQQVGGGSGFIIESDGLIVTNKHVVSDETATYNVVLSDGRILEATILAKDPILDVALLDIDAEGLPTVSLGNSDSLKLGQTVIAIGNALSEFGNTVTRGVVSGIGRRVEAGNGQGMVEVLEEAIQTDAAINPGNSGGPLLNLAGEVVGINTAVSSQGQLVGFAISINSVKQSIESVREVGRIIRPWLGVRYAPVTARMADENNLPVRYGALILRGSTPDSLAVVPGSPADKAGLVENDIILEINGEKLEDKDSLTKEIAKYNVGDMLTLTVYHKGEEKEVRITLEEFPTS